MLGVPHGSDKRLEHWPGLKASDEVINVVGESGEKAVAGSNFFFIRNTLKISILNN